MPQQHYSRARSGVFELAFDIEPELADAVQAIEVCLSPCGTAGQYRAIPKHKYTNQGVPLLTQPYGNRLSIHNRLITVHRLAEAITGFRKYRFLKKVRR